MLKIIYKLLFFSLLFFSCRQYKETYFFYYQVETTSPKISASFRTIDGTIKTQPIFNSWIYGWGSPNENSKFYIQVRNDTTFGSIKVRVIRDRDTLITKTHTTQVTIQ